MELLYFEIVAHCPVCNAPVYGPRAASPTQINNANLLTLPVAARRSCGCQQLQQRKLQAEAQLAELAVRDAQAKSQA